LRAKTFASTIYLGFGKSASRNERNNHHPFLYTILVVNGFNPFLYTILVVVVQFL
jgi:hypothetical protein